MKITPLLIDNNEQYANQQIVDLKNLARLATELIQTYNKMPVISPIELATDAKEFLLSPIKFFDEMILNNCGISFGKTKPDPAAIAALYKIPYSGMVARAQGIRLSPEKLSMLAFDEGSLQVIILPETEDLIREKAKIYLTNEEQISRYDRLKKLSDELNAFCLEYHIPGNEINSIARSLPFVSAVPGKAGQWSLGPNLTLIKNGSRKQVI